MEIKRILIVGAGFAGAVTAERLANAGYQVLIIDRRSHIGGNAYDEIDSNGVLVHRYGPHIFHTNSKRVFDYLSRFTGWRYYEHRVLAMVDNEFYPIPINRTTINKLYGLELNESEVADFIKEVREPREDILTSEDVVLSSVGKDLCDKFFRNYTKKQWGLELSELSAGVARRIPTRTNDDDRYFTDDYQALPLNGYTAMFERMLDHPNITIELDTDYRLIGKQWSKDITVYTGPIDEYFGCCFGRLPYRSLYFEHEHIQKLNRYQQVGTVNYPNDYEFTRITEFKHLTGQSHPGTSIVREYPKSSGEPYYPIPTQQNEELYRKYEMLAKREKNVVFVGRLAQYRYLNMDCVVSAALQAAKNIIEKCDG